MARTPTITLHLLVTLVCIILSSERTSSSSAYSSDVDAFLSCLSADISPSLIYTPANNNYSSVLLSSVRNLRYYVGMPDTTRPLVIVAATEPAHVQTTVVCGRRHSVHVRTRSGGHD
jgi:hypothetical protein